MDSLARILHLEDNINDSELVQSMLAEDGLTCEILRVETHAAFAAALDQRRFHLIISDFSLPSYDGQSALRVAKERHPDIPFLFFSGTIGEERAVEALRAGATDYVLKHNPARLVSSVRRALRETEERAARKLLEDQLRQSQKMEAIGQLTGGIAHDFNNLLTVINGYSELSLQALSTGDPLYDNLEQIKEAGSRAAALTRQLLAFSRKQVLEPKVLDLNAIVTNLDKLLQRVIGEDIDLVPLLKPGLGRVKADPGQIEQVIMNLAVNARDAMPEGGKLTIETANVELDEHLVKRHMAMKPGPYVMLAISDTGCGMDAEIQKRIFEPFFTTKESGKGTGLGLATSYGIVKQSGGSIWVYSEVGKGTTFKIYLPRVTETAESIFPGALPSSSLAGSETILLVEDSEPLRKLVHAILAKCGYAMLVASTRDEALQICRQYSGSIHLMLTDVVLPGMTIRELADRLVAIRPDMKVLHMSGYTDETIVRHGVLEAGVAYLQKPFTGQTLLRKVREVLDAPGKEPT